MVYISGHYSEEKARRRRRSQCSGRNGSLALRVPDDGVIERNGTASYGDLAACILCPRSTFVFFLSVTRVL